MELLAGEIVRAKRSRVFLLDICCGLLGGGSVLTRSIVVHAIAFTFGRVGCIHTGIVRLLLISSLSPAHRLCPCPAQVSTAVSSAELPATSIGAIRVALEGELLIAVRGGRIGGAVSAGLSTGVIHPTSSSLPTHIRDSELSRTSYPNLTRVSFHAPSVMV